MKHKDCLCEKFHRLGLILILAILGVSNAAGLTRPNPDDQSRPMYDFSVGDLSYFFVGDDESNVTEVWVFGPAKDYVINVNIPEKVSYQGKEYNVTGIAFQAFCEDTYLMGISIPKSVLVIQDQPFVWCESLQYINVDAANPNYSSIDGILYDKSLTTLLAYPARKVDPFTIPATVNKIYKYAFCSSQIPEFDVPDSIETIEEYAFLDSKIITFNFNEKVDIIKPYTFFRCGNLNNIKFNSEIKEIGEQAFVMSGINEIILPEKLEIIGESAFYYSGLTKITLPPSLKEIGTSAFGLTMIQDIEIPEKITFLPAKIFEDCLQLRNVELSKNLQFIGEHAFSGCMNLSQLTIPSKVSLIGGEAFAWCNRLKTLILEPVSPPSCGNFDQENYNITYLIVPETSLPAYKSTLPWSNFKNIISDSELPASISLNYNEVTVPTGIGIQLEAIIAPSGSYDVIDWRSLDSEIAEVSETGYVHANEVGTTIITAKLGDWSSSCIVNVIPEYQIFLNLESVELNIGETVQLEATVLPEEITEKTVQWFTYGESVVTVSDNGLVTAVAPGIAGITAHYHDAEVECLITVLEPIIDPESIQLNIESAELNIGDSFQLQASVWPENTSDPTVLWSTSDENIATVSDDGTVTAIGLGNATITASCGEAYANCEVTVNELVIKAEFIQLNIESAELNIGESFQLQASVWPENTSDPTVLWSTSDENIATVSDDGTVTAIAPGYATITGSCGDASANCEVTVIEDAGIESLLANPENKISIYTSDGMVIKKDCNVEELKTLHKGIYIIVSGKDRYKISI